MLRTVRALRYVTPLREGGSMPAIVEADDDGTYVLKFRGAAQGPKALVAEVIAGEVGRALGLPVPEIVLAEVDPSLGRSEEDPDIQALIKRSPGLNLALDFLPGSFGFEPLASPPPDPALASAIVWFDAYMANVDRTARNPNVLVWHKRLWLIDHGAALYYHHRWPEFPARSRDPFAAIKNHLFLARASGIGLADRQARARLDRGVIEAIAGALPETWLDGTAATEYRRVYAAFLLDRLEASQVFVEEAENARAALV